MVAITTTVNHSFGSKLVSRKTGILFNNQMDDFTVSMDAVNGFGLKPSKSNVIAPGKRPLSSMSPTIVTTGIHDKRVLALGASGGPTIISTVVQIITAMLDLGKHADEAVNFPRLHHQLVPNKIQYETGFPRVLVESLQEKGHVVEEAKVLADGHMLGNCQLVYLREEGKIEAASDPRKMGEPSGYFAHST
eukprot:GFYU01017816.1.p1 GENE.GFYU01017816.1~~GFYU01017816.1.p1  ORF type:complete len:214 (-),score=27.25 GFYU01017816.1:426-998(-)